jgi:alkylation response protein AidB-like acyl-CoA dehydrogenase
VGRSRRCGAWAVRETAALEDRLAWERELGAHGWIGLGWPKEAGGRGASLAEQVIYNEEYVRAKAPGRMGHIGETLLAPTLIAFGTPAQQRRFLPGIRSGEVMWCQGYSEPNAGSDLANVQTRARLEGDRFVIDGQKVWTSHAAWSQWCFVIARTHPTAPRHKGLSYLLVPMDQPGITSRPIQQITGDAEFFEVFLDGAVTDADALVGELHGGWRVAMGTLAFERGASTLGQQLGFADELREITELARANGRIDDASIRDRLSRAWMELEVMRLNALRMLSAAMKGELSREGMITKLYWATWHRNLGELALDVAGLEGQVVGEGGELTRLQRLFLFSRSDTIYAGTNQVQRNIIAERALGMPRGPRP